MSEPAKGWSNTEESFFQFLFSSPLKKILHFGNSYSSVTMLLHTENQEH